MGPAHVTHRLRPLGAPRDLAVPPYRYTRPAADPGRENVSPDRIRLLEAPRFSLTYVRCLIEAVAARDRSGRPRRLARRIVGSQAGSPRR